MLLQSGVARAQAIATGAGIPFVVEVFSDGTI